MKKKLIIIDMDIAVYLAAYSVNDSRNKELGIAAINSYVSRIFEATKATEYLGFFQSKSYNFRYDIYPEYKANRVDKKQEWAKFWKPIMTKVLQDQWGFIDVSPYNIESDDAVSIAYAKFYKEFDESDIILVHGDKDLNNIYPENGEAHIWYNYKTTGWFRVRKQRSIFFFWKQMIMGDSGDNIKGVFGLGKTFADKLLLPVQKHPWRMFRRVYKEYIKKYPETFRAQYILNYNLLNLMDSMEGFEVPKPRQVPDLMEKIRVELLNI